MFENDVADGDRRNSLLGHWSSRFTFILAVTGSAVGLGNIWKFPYIAGQNGGGAFVLVYLFFVFLVGMPVMMSEILIGRRGRRNPVATMKLLGEEEGGASQWRYLGYLAIVGSMLILSYYSFIAGWALSYVYESVSGTFVGANAAEVTATYRGFASNWAATAIAHTLFMATTVALVARGVKRGLEWAVRLMVPALVGLMILLLIFSINTGYFSAGVEFLLAPNFTELSWSGVLIALGQAFFTLSIGIGAVMAYGAYLPQETSIPGTAAVVVCADTVIALLAGLIVFPIVFANGLDPAEGPGLVFMTLPSAFGQMSGGIFYAAVFFLLLSFAAWTSAFSMMEPSVAWVVERFNRSRVEAAVIIGFLIWLMGFGSVLSFSVLSEFKFYKGTIYENIDHLTSNILLPIGGFFIVVFAGWVMCRNSTAEELGGVGPAYSVWRFLARYVAPVAIVVVFLQTSGLL